MPFGKLLKKFGYQIKTESNTVSNDRDNHVHNIKEMLSNLGINNENRETFDIGMPYPLKPLNKQEPIKYKWIANTSSVGSDDQEKGEQAKLVLKALIETKCSNELNDVTNEFLDHFSKLNPGGVVAYMTTAKKLGINPDGCVGTALKNMGQYPAKWNKILTKELFTKYDVTNPYCSFDNKIEQKELIKADQKIILINGKEVELKEFIKLLYDKDKTSELDYNIKMLSPENSDVMKNELTLQLAYDFYKNKKELSEIKVISKRIGTTDKLDEYLSFNIDQLREEEVNLTGRGEYSYLDMSFEA